ncbi:MAG: LuxR C-terminal-related transcriptional regulator [Myxococcota bacterium]
MSGAAVVVADWLPRIYGLVESAGSLEEYRLEILRLLRAEVGGAAAVFIPGPPLIKADGRMLKALRTVYLDLAPRGLQHILANLSYFRRELAATGEASLRAAPWIDADLFPANELARLRLWSEVMAPDSFGSFLIVPSVFQGEHFGSSCFFRRIDAPRFTREEAERVSPLLPLLIMGDRLKAHVLQHLIPATGVRRPIGALTGREQQVAQLAASGLQHKGIAEALGLSPNTVRNTLSQVFDKLEVTTRTQLAAVLFEATAHG